MKLKQYGKTILLFALVFLVQTTLLPPRLAQSLDLIFLAVIVATLNWGVRGVLVGGITGGVLTGVVSSAPFLKVVFFYTVLAYLSYLLFGEKRQRSLGQTLVLSALLTTYYLLAQTALFTPSQITDLGVEDVYRTLPNFVGLFALLQAGRYLSTTSESRERSEIAMGSILR